MPESPVHKSLKPHAAKWLESELGCVTLTEPTIAKRWSLKCRPDVFGVCFNHPESKRLGLCHDVEVEPSLKGIESEYRKEHRRSPFESITDYQWLMYPDTIEPDCETLRIPTWVGLLTCTDGGLVRVQREAKLIDAHSKYAVRSRMLLMTSQLVNYRRDSGKSPGQVRPAAKAHAITRQEASEAVRYVATYADQDYPEVPTSLVARHLGVKHAKLLKAIREGLLPELEHDSRMKTLVVKELKASA